MRVEIDGVSCSTSALLLETGGAVRPVTASGRVGESLASARGLAQLVLHCARPLGIWGVQDGEFHRLRSRAIRHDLQVRSLSGIVILSNDGENILSYLSRSQVWCDAGGASRGDLLIAPQALFDRLTPLQWPASGPEDVFELLGLALGQRSRLSPLAC